MKKSRILVITITVVLVFLSLLLTSSYLASPLLFIGTVKRLRKYSVMDIYLAAWLSLKGHRPEFTRQGTRVTFEFPASDEVYRDAATYNGNPSDVPLLDFIAEVRKMRAQMLAARG